MDPNQSRRRFLRALPAAAGLCMTLKAVAQDMPAAARIVIGYPPGGSADVVGRKLAESLSGRLARTVIVENKSGAAGRIGIDAMRSAPADGSAMVLTPASVLTMYPHIYKNLSYDVFADLAPVSLVATFGFALMIGPMVPDTVQTFGQFAAWCRANPKSAQCGNPGAGSFPHFMAMLMARDANLGLAYVPYRGGLLAVQAVLAGQLAAALVTEGTALPFEHTCRLRILATTGSERSEFMPQVPTFRELGYTHLVQREWFGIFMPAKTPPGAIAAAAEAIRVSMRQPDVCRVLSAIAVSAEGSTPAELQHRLRSEYDFWGPLIHASGFTAES